MATATEKRIIEERKARGILVPILESALENPIHDTFDEEDEWFMVELMRARGRSREKSMFSPSMLSSCLRQSYFAVTGKEKRPAISVRANGYFIEGDFRHYKWQFALWKCHRLGLLELLGVEVRVYHSSGDFAGTIDAIIRINGKIYVVDFKGLNVRSFQLIEHDGAPLDYRMQLVGYSIILVNAQFFESFLGTWAGFEIAGCLLVAENKAGPVQRGSPLALHEVFIPITSARSKVKNRLRVLREYRDNQEIPPPDCKSTRIIQFEQCPFAYRCRDEVRAIQREREKTARKNLHPATPSR